MCRPMWRGVRLSQTGRRILHGESQRRIGLQVHLRVREQPVRRLRHGESVADHAAAAERRSGRVGAHEVCRDPSAAFLHRRQRLLVSRVARQVLDAAGR